jgi:tetratricopeptide (TPR) repeat protein
MSYLYLGVSYAYQGDLEHALPLLEMSIEVGPRNEWAHINYAIYLYYFDPSKVEKVNEHFRIALDLLPNDLRLWQAVISFWVDKNFEQQREYCKLATQQGIEAQNLCDGVE